jgi:RNA-binding protein
MAVLTTKQKQFLKGLAHPLSPIVRVGKGGVTASVVEETKKSLHAHELIKVRIEVDESAARRELASRLAGETDAQLAGTVGKIAILYRRRDEEPEIKLPK